MCRVVEAEWSRAYEYSLGKIQKSETAVLSSRISTPQFGCRSVYRDALRLGRPVLKTELFDWRKPIETPQSVSVGSHPPAAVKEGTLGISINRDDVIYIIRKITGKS
ncbi:hypothetical protein TNCV_4820871 [Trichonephila clavipes]|nr:hypothetical protein TNCV_4820871 [Trichonephila clavipes]